MKRAIVWLCWGERFIGEAIDSARSAAAIEADRVLITDAEGAQYAKGNPAFTSIVQTQLIYANNLEKSRLVDLLPGGYDTFLYLDTDAKIVGDVSLGFAKAEQHGIAMAPAPNYNLPEYFNFARIMRELGVEPADQIMYNAGVIFFHLTAAVRQVFERWRDLARPSAPRTIFRATSRSSIWRWSSAASRLTCSPRSTTTAAWANMRSATSVFGIRTSPRRPTSMILKMPGRRGASPTAYGFMPAMSGRRPIAGGRRRCRSCR